MIYVLGFVFQWNDLAKKAGGVFISAILFSTFHFVGPYGDDPQIDLFTIRFIAGLILGAIYVFRGFGIAAYTHTIYDLFVLTKFTTTA